MDEDSGSRITALKVQKRNRQRVNVHIDGRYAFGLTAIEAMRLRVGQHLSTTEIARLKERDNGEVAFDRALTFLSYRPRSVAEVRRRMTEKQFAPQIIDTVIDRLNRAGLLDDEAFARYWLENRDAFKPRGRRALRYELRQKGITDDVIDAAMTGYDEVDAAYRAALSQSAKLARRNDDIDTFRSKLLAFLTRRGFSYHVARDTVEQVLTELDREGRRTDE